MRLLNTTTLKLKLFLGKNKPDYVILSHVWGEDEITFKDFDDDGVLKPGIAERRAKSYEKIIGTAEQARKDNYEWMWIDTCTIDKSSSSELQEAINSMWRWYELSNICYAYLADVPAVEFQQSVWFTRGWTLQELLAPVVVEFFDCSWTLLGTRYSRADQIHEVTNIDKTFLQTSYKYCNAATVFSWMAHRRTSREEDSVYSLFGLCEIMMPLFYGEGVTQALRRFLDEIMKKHRDSTIFLHKNADGLLRPLLPTTLQGFCLKGDCGLCDNSDTPDIPYSSMRILRTEAPIDMTIDAHYVRCTFLKVYQDSFPPWQILSRFKQHRSRCVGVIMVLNLQTSSGMRIGVPMVYDKETDSCTRYDEVLVYLRRTRGRLTTFNLRDYKLNKELYRAKARLFLTLRHPQFKQSQLLTGRAFSKYSKIRPSRDTTFSSPEYKSMHDDWDVCLATESASDDKCKLTLFLAFEPSRMPHQTWLLATCGPSYQTEQDVPEYSEMYLGIKRAPDGWVYGTSQVTVQTETHAVDIQIRQMPSETPQNPDDLYLELRIEDIENESTDTSGRVAPVEDS